MVDVEAALAPGAPRVYAELPDNVCSRLGAENPMVDQLFAAAAGTVKLRLVNQRVAPVSMEPRAVLAQWDEGQQKLTMWTSNQAPHGAKQNVAVCLGIPEMRVRIIAPEVGGAFGCKIPTYPEECLLPWIARKLRRPVKWAETRTDNLQNTTHGRGHVEYIEASYTATGEVTAMSAYPFEGTNRNGENALPTGREFPTIPIALASTGGRKGSSRSLKIKHLETRPFRG